MKLRATVAALAVASTLSLSACGGIAGTTSSGDTTSGPEVTRVLTVKEVAANTDPKKGWVLVSNDLIGGYEAFVVKRCDGTTLLYVQFGYRKGGPAVVADSTECTR